MSHRILDDSNRPGVSFHRCATIRDQVRDAQCEHHRCVGKLWGTV